MNVYCLINNNFNNAVFIVNDSMNPMPKIIYMTIFIFCMHKSFSVYCSVLCKYSYDERRNIPLLSVYMNHLMFSLLRKYDMLA